MASKAELARLSKDFSISASFLSLDEHSSYQLVTSDSASSVQNLAEQWASIVKQRVSILDDDGARDAVPELHLTAETVLKQEVIAVFIWALHRNNGLSWQFLLEALLKIEHYHRYLTACPELHHYASRVCRIVELDSSQSGNMQIVSILQSLFPEIAKQKNDRYNVYERGSPTPPKQTKSSSTPRTKHRVMLPDGRNPYALQVTDHKPSNLLSLSDLSGAMANVALQIATREAIWSACLGTTALAVNVDLPAKLDDASVELDLTRTDQSELSSKPPAEVKGELNTVVKKESVTPMTGREAVEHFAKCHHLGKIESMHFNIVPNRRFTPYTLVQVPEDKIEAEHYVFSTFGVLHVYNDRTSECLSLAAWQREAVLWTATNKIPFFRNYLLRKTFTSWRANVSYARYASIRHQVGTQLIQAMPCYGAALLQVSRLCHEILQLQLLPINTSRCFLLAELQNEINVSLIHADKILERFYHYIQIILTTAHEELLKRLEHCQELANSKQVFSSTESLYEQKVKRQQKIKNLEKVTFEASFYPVFVTVAKQMVLGHIIQLVRESVSKFVNSLTVSSPEGARDGYLKASFIFATPSGRLELMPARDHISAVLGVLFSVITSCITRMSVLLAGCNPSKWPVHRESSRQISFGQLLSGRRASVNDGVERLSERKTSEAAEAGGSNLVELSHSPVNAKQTDECSADALSAYNVAAKLDTDDMYQLVVGTFRQIIESSLADIDDFCQKNTWLCDLNRFCIEWTPAQLQQLKDAPAYVMEQKLSELSQWCERLRSYELSLVADSSFLVVHCDVFFDDLLPRMEAIYHRTGDFVADECITGAQRLCDELTQCLQVMSSCGESLDEFALYARSVQTFRKNILAYQQRVDYSKKLFEVVRSGVPHVSLEDDKLEETVPALWERFLGMLQDAVEQVNLRTPLITQNLDDKLQKLKLEAGQVCDKATTGKFLDASNKPTSMLLEMMQLRDRFYEIRKEVEDLNMWKEAITGEPYDMGFLNEASAKLDVRQELWKYFEVSSLLIREWSETAFKKFNVRKAIDKVTEWKSAADRLSTRVPADDQVLLAWRQQLEGFQKHLPLLLKLSSKALRVHHWKQIFHSLRLEYDPSYAYTVGDLMALNLVAHSRLIDSLLSAAVDESVVQERFDEIRALWSDREFKLVLHVPESVRRVSNETIQSRRQTFKAARDQKLTNFIRSDLYILTDVSLLKYLLEDSRLSLQAVLTTSNLSSLRQEIMSWDSNLSEIEELVNLWHACQNQWLYLLKVFDDHDLCQRMEKQTESFLAVHSKFVDFIKAVVNDPKVLSILEKSRGEKGYRFHQGNRLRLLLSSLKQTMAEILHSLSSLLDETRCQFPRLYFVSDEELVEVLAATRDVRQLSPVARKCFPGIVDIVFEVPTTVDDTFPGGASGTRFAVNVDKMEACRLRGSMAEELVLYARVRPQAKTTRWLTVLERSMKTTVQLELESCVQARLDDGCKQPIQLLEDFAYEVEDDHSTSSSIGHKHWILQFPAQCVLTADAILWEREARRAVEKSDKNDLKTVSLTLSDRLSQYARVLNDRRADEIVGLQPRLHCLLGNLINQSIYHREVIDRLRNQEIISDVDFKWLSILRYRMEIETILNARPESASNTGLISKLSYISAADESSSSPVPCGIYREATRVSTGYQFGQCMASQMGRSFAYDCEYSGCCDRLVLTPLTERAYVSLTLALKNYQCGLLVGRSSVGKCSTIKDLALALGRHLVSFDCTEQLSLTSINRYLTGMIQSGSWGLFENGNRINTGMLSVLGQHLDHLSQAMKVLDLSVNNQYGIRGQSKIDKKGATKSDTRIRRNSLTTLHSLPVSTDDAELRPRPFRLERQKTVPHGCNEEGLVTYFEDPWICERSRRISIEKEVQIIESKLYKSKRLTARPPLLYEQLALSRRSKISFGNVHQQFPTRHSEYRPTYIGNVPFNGSLVRANANFGCFMTFTVTGESDFVKMPSNLKASLRLFAALTPDTKIVMEVLLYRSGFSQSKTLAAKLDTFFNIIRTQVTHCCSYDFGLRTVVAVLKFAALRLKCGASRVAAGSVASRGSSAAAAQHHKRLDPDITVCSNDDGRSGESSNSSTSSSVSSFLAMSESLAHEESTIVVALESFLLTRMLSDHDCGTLKALTREVFPTGVRLLATECRDEEKTQIDMLNDALIDQLRAIHLDPNESFIAKMVQLYSCLLMRPRGLLLVGPAGAGKTTSCIVLGRALTQLHGHQQLQRKLAAGSGSKRVNSASVGLNQTGHRLPSSQTSMRSAEGKDTRLLLPQQSVGSVSGTDAQVAVSDRVEFPKVDVDILYPNVFTVQELFGHYEGHVWQTGLLAAMFDKAFEQAESTRRYGSHTTASTGRTLSSADPLSITSFHKWLVLDGELSQVWIDCVNALVGIKGEYRMPNGKEIRLHDSATVVFEVSHLTDATPSTVSRCALMCFENDTVSWKSLINSWSLGANERWTISMPSLQMLNNLMLDTVPLVLDFLVSLCPITDDRLNNVGEFAFRSVKVASFLRIFSCLLDGHLLREHAVIPESSGASTSTSMEGSSALSLSPIVTSGASSDQAQVLRHLYFFAFIWGFGADLTDEFVHKFDEFIRHAVSTKVPTVLIPEGASVFDYFLDQKRCTMVRWSERSCEKIKNIEANYIPIPELNRYNYWIDLLMSSGYATLITGGVGVGKTSLVENLVQKKHQMTRITMNPRLTSAKFQETLESGMNQKQDVGSVGKTKKSTRKLFFIDDLSCVPYFTDAINTGSSPNLELLRQLINQKAVLNRTQLKYVQVNDINLLATSTNPKQQGSGYGYTRHPIGKRLLRLFTTINIITPNENQLLSIYGRKILTWLNEFPSHAVEHCPEFSEAIVLSVTELYSSTREKFKPIAGRSQCVFSLHDVAHVFSGITLMSTRSSTKQGVTPVRAVAVSIVRLLGHEVMRTFADRFTSSEDSRWLETKLRDVVQRRFYVGKLADEQQEDIQPTAVSSDGAAVNPIFVGNIAVDSPCPIVKVDVSNPAEIEAARSVSEMKGVRILSPNSSPRGRARENGRGCVFTGPLLTNSQIRLHSACQHNDTAKSFQMYLDELVDLSSVIFSKYLMSSYSGDQLPYKGYSEIEVARLTATLEECVPKYRPSRDLVFFQSAVEHVARLSRVLALPGGHALLLARGHSTGRTTVVRLVAQMANYKLFEPAHTLQSSTSSSHEVFIDQLKQGSMSAGIRGKPSVILVHEELGESCLTDLCTFINDANFPGLYSSSEMHNIAGQISLSNQSKMTPDRVDASMLTYLHRVRSNLHVVVCLRYSADSSLQEKVNKWPELFTKCFSCDLYKPWTNEDYATVAEKWLSDEMSQSTGSSSRPLSQKMTSLVSQAMAQIRRDVTSEVEQLYPSHHHHLISPTSLRDLVVTFKSLVDLFIRSQTDIIAKYEVGVDKIKAANESIAAKQQEWDVLSGKYCEVTDRVGKLEASIEEKKQQHQQMLASCQREEDRISSLMSSMEMIKSTSTIQLEEVDPLYQNSVEALMALDQHSVEELRSYRNPPDGVKKVMSAVCMLFNVPMSSWEDARVLLIRDNFFLELVYFDKSQLAPSAAKRLAEYCSDPSFTHDSVRLVSKAASHVCQWLQALNAYSRRKDNIRPTMEKLLDTQSEMKRSQESLGKQHMDAVRLKSELDREERLHREKSAYAKELERQLQTAKKFITTAADLMDRMTTHHTLWKSRVKSARSAIKSVFADSLLTAACVTYFGSLDLETCSRLLEDWHSKLENGNLISPGSLTRAEDSTNEDSTDSSALTVSESYSLTEVLDLSDLLAVWNASGRLSDVGSQNKVALLYSCMFHLDVTCRWPLLVDVHSCAEEWIAAVRELRNLVNLPFNSDDGHGGGEVSASSTARDTEESGDGDVVDETAVNTEPEPIAASKDETFRIVASDDLQLETTVISALENGWMLLITHLERANLGLSYGDLLRRQYTIDESGARFVRVGERMVACRTTFKLLFSTSFPITFRGGGMTNLPLGELLLIDLSLGHEALRISLLDRVLNVERPELESQKYTMRRDVLHLNREIAQRKNLVMETVRKVDCCVLEDRAISLLVDECQAVIDGDQTVLIELQYLQKHLDAKEASLIPVAENSARMYSVLCQIHRLCPYYYISLADFLQVFDSAIRSRNHGRSRTGAPEARALELIDATTRAIFSHASSMVFAEHASVLALLFTMERMLSSNMSSRNELLLFINGVNEDAFILSESPPKLMDQSFSGAVFDTFHLDAAVLRFFGNRQSFIDPKIISRGISLEAYSSSFRGLGDSLKKYQEDWREYFENAFELLIEPPGQWIQSLTLFQKCLLWRVCLPERAYEVSQHLIVHEFGDVIRDRHLLDMNKVYAQSNSSLPVVFLLPSSDGVNSVDPERLGMAGRGHVLNQPVHDVFQLARDTGMEGRVRVVACGSGSSQLAEIQLTLEDCVQSGYWLILQNTHLIGEWNKSLLDSIKNIVYTDEVRDKGNKVATPIHKDFRLWITTEVDLDHLSPGLVIERAVKVAYDQSSSFWNTLHYASAMMRKMYAGRNVKGGSLPRAKTVDYRAYSFISFVHSLLVHQQQCGLYSGYCHWSFTDLSVIVDQLRMANWNLLSHGGDIAQAVALVYAGQCVSPQDAIRVSTLCRKLFRTYMRDGVDEVNYLK